MDINKQTIIETIVKDDLELFQLLFPSNNLYINEFQIIKSRRKIVKSMDKIYFCMQLINYDVNRYMNMDSSYDDFVKSKEITCTYLTDLFEYIQLCLENDSKKILDYVLISIIPKCYYVIQKFENSEYLDSDESMMWSKYDDILEDPYNSLERFIYCNKDETLKFMKTYVEKDYINYVGLDDSFFLSEIIEYLSWYKKEINKEEKEIIIKWLCKYTTQSSLQKVREYFLSENEDEEFTDEILEYLKD